MATIKLEAHVSVDALVEAAAQLDASDLERFAAEVLGLRAARAAPSVPENEAALLKRVSQRLPQDVQDRYEALISKRDSESLTDEEYQELLRLTKRAEALDADRLRALRDLASVRGVTLGQLMSQLEVNRESDE